MIRLLIRSLFWSVLLWFILIILALMAGRSIDDHIITAVGVVPRTNRVIFHLADLEKHVQVNIRPPINGITQVSLAPDGRHVLVYTSNINLQAQAFLVFDIQSRRVIYREDMPGQVPSDIFVARQFEEFQPLWSPDSHRLVFRDPGSRGIYVIDLETLTTHHPFQDALAFIYGESWSPDSQSLVFMSGGDIWFCDVQTYTIRRLTNNPANISALNWSPDNSRIVYHYLIESERLMQSFMLDIHTGDARSISPGDAYAPVWSPDGMWIAYLSGRSGQRDAYTLRLSDNATYRLNTERMQDVHTIAWSPDSQQLALADADGEIYITAPTASSVSLAAENAMNLQWSPDNQYLTFERVEMFSRRFQRSLHLRAEAHLPQQVTNSMSLPRWSADSNYLSYLYQTVNGSQVEIFDVAAQELRYRSDINQYIVDFAFWR